MLELLQAALHPVNFLFTILLLVIIFYWISVIIGALDINTFDFDLDVDTDLDIDIDVDVDADMDVDTEAEVGSSGGLFAGALHFFNFGKLPFMVIMSFAILISWFISITTNHYFGKLSYGFAIALFIPNIFVSLLLTKWITSPLVPLFKTFDEGVEPVDFIGQSCILTMTASSKKMGQANVEIENNKLLVNVKTEEEDGEVLKKGEEALIVGKSENGKFYFVKRL